MAGDVIYAFRVMRLPLLDAGGAEIGKIADIVLVATLTVPVIGLGLITGVRFETGILGMLAFIALASLATTLSHGVEGSPMT